MVLNDCFKKTNNLSILQSAMRHSTLGVTYWKAILSLRLEDIPRL